METNLLEHLLTMRNRSHITLLNQFNTNVFGTMNLTRAFLPFFRARESGTIVMISSVDAWVGRAGFGAYTASKYALEGERLKLHSDFFVFLYSRTTFTCYHPGYGVGEWSRQRHSSS